MSEHTRSRYSRQFRNGHASQNGKHSVSIGDVAKSIDLQKLIESDLGEPQGGTARDPKWCCPFHEENTPSFHIQPDGKHFKCFGCDASGDAIDYVAKRDGIEPIEAARRLSGEPEPEPTAPGRAKASRPRPEPARFPKAIHKDLNGAIAATAQRLKGKEASRYAYHHADGKPAFWQVRFDLPGGKKTFRPFHQNETQCFCEGNPITSGRPLYRLPVIDKHRSEAASQWVLLCEGEKCAEQAVSLGFQATTSSHGSQSADGTDFSPLAGLKIVLIPDNDQAGEKYIADVQEQLARLDPRPTVKILRLPGLSEGEDLIEWSERGGTADQLIGLIEKAPEWNKPKPFRLNFITTEEFFKREYKFEWLIQSLWLKSMPGAFAGPIKSLKTTLLIDLGISLATATPFLGRWAVPKPTRMGLISIESGEPTLRARAQTIAEARGIERAADLNNFVWEFQRLNLTNAEHMKAVATSIRENGLEVIAFDPWYLVAHGQAAGIDPKNMFDMGRLLSEIAAVCLENGATPILAHHFTKKRESPYAPPDLGEMAYAGINEFVRQWVLVARRERFNAETGINRLHFHYGGSAGQFGEYAVDIDEGRLADDFTGRKWLVSISTPAEHVASEIENQGAERARKSDEKAREKAEDHERATRRDMGEAMERMGKLHKGKFTARNLRDATGWRPDRVKHIICRLGEEGRIKSVKVTAIVGNGGKRECDGFQIVE